MAPAAAEGAGCDGVEAGVNAEFDASFSQKLQQQERSRAFSLRATVQRQAAR